MLGKRFTERDLGALAEPELDLDEALDGLIELGLFEEERRGRSDRLSFGSSVVREVVYRHLAPRRRRLLHQRYAEALEARFESGRSGLAPHLLRHVQAAGDVERTVRFGRETAAEALRAFSPREAIQALETALEVVVELPRERGAAEAELRLYMARAQTMAGNHSRGLSESERAAAGFAHLGDDEHRLEAVLVAAEAAWSGRRVEAAHFWVQQGIEFARARGRRADLVRLLNLAAMAANLSGEHVAARNYLEEVEELRRRAPSDPASTDVGGSSPVYSAPMGEVALGELHVPQTATLETLDPAAGDFVDHLEIVANVFETLTRLGEGMRVEPWLARRFEVEEGGGRYRLELREARFHDGRRLSAHDVRYTFERLLRLPSPDLHHYLLPIRGARAWRDGLSERLEGCLVIDPRRLVLELERPLVFFPALLSHPALAILPEGAAEGDPSWWLRGVGTGPFRIGRVEPGERVELERHPDYWRPATPRLERLIFHGGLEPREILRRFRAGRLDVASDLRPEDVEALCRDREFAGGFREAPRLCTYYLGFGSHRGLFADLPRRRALAQLLDVDRPFRAALQRAAIRATTFLPPGLNGAAPRAFERPAPLADTEARALLRGRTVRVAVYPSYLGQYADFWERLRTQLDDLGMVVETRLGAPAELDALLPTGEIDLILDRWLADYPDADAFAFALLHSTEGALAGFGGSPEIDRLADGARRERDPVRRRAMYDRIEEILHREALIVPFFHEQLYRFYHPSVRHLRVRLFAPEVRYDEIFIDPSAAFENRGRARK